MQITGILIIFIMVALVIAMYLEKIQWDKIKKTFGLVVGIMFIAGIGWLIYQNWSGSKNSRPKKVVALTSWHMPACAGGGFNFRKVKMPVGVKVNFHPNCVTAVKLPDYAMFNIEPSTEVQIRFINGMEFIDGPGPQYQNWAGVGVGREAFKVYGIKDSGVLEIHLEKRKE